MTIKEVFCEESDIVELKLTPELKEKIIIAFTSLEDLLIEAFPTSRLLSQVLTFLEIAAMYFKRLAK